MRGTTLELRHALEPWHVLGEEPAGGATARFVDSSVERVQVLASGWVDERFVLACNGSAVPLTPTERVGEHVGGVRFKAWQPPVSALHPTIPAQTPLVFDIYDRWTGRSLGGLTHHVSHPGGLSYEHFPVNANEAEARRRSRFFPFGHTAGTDGGAGGVAFARASAHAGLAPVGLTGQPSAMSRDEMVDGKGGLRPQWRSLLGVLAGLGRGVLAERAGRLERVMEEEGAASLLPGSPPDPWRFDPIPLPLAQAEFIALEAGLAQRARLLDAVLADLYGAQRLLADGALPPALVYANPAFLRPCRHDATPHQELLQFYAADLVRAPDGTWTVLADRTGLADGLAHALQNRRRLGRVVPELFVSQLLCHIDPFVELCLDMLRRIVPAGTAALLTPGHADPAWYGHVLLARELSCTLVEGGDLTVRDGGLFLKTLRGLQPISVLLRGVAGSAGRSAGTRRRRRRRIRPARRRARSRADRQQPGQQSRRGAGLAAFLPDLATRLLGEDLALPSVPTVWLGDSVARASVLAAPGRMVRSPGARQRLAAGAVGGDGGAAAAGVARPDGGGSVAIRGERGGDALGRSLPRRRRAGAASGADPHVPGPRPGRLACDAGRAGLRAVGRGAGVAEHRAGACQGCLGPGGEPRRDRGPSLDRDATAGDPSHRPATCPVASPTTTSGSGAIWNDWKARRACCASRSAASAGRRRRRMRWPNSRC